MFLLYLNIKTTYFKQNKTKQTYEKFNLVFLIPHLIIYKLFMSK